MRRLLCTFCIIFFAFGKSFPQGFEWELSPRLPFSIPKFYAGIQGAISKNFFNGTLTLYENYFSCAKFTSGTGGTNSFGVKVEFWYKHDFAFNASLNFQTSNGKFVALGDSFPVEIKGIPKVVKVENELAMKYKHFVADIGAKYRIASSHFFLGANLEFGFKFSSSYDLYEQVKSPPEYHFIDNTQRRKLVEGNLSDLSLLFVNPKILVGYDAILFPEIYASPSVAFYIPLFNFSREENLKLFSINFCFAIMRGIR